MDPPKLSNSNNNNQEIYPGCDNRFVICDVCGGKFRVKETVRIRDPFNFLNQMIVCFKDADETNPQIKPIYIQEDLIKLKDYIRPEVGYRYALNEDETRLPTAPQYLAASLAPNMNVVQLTWQGPQDLGDGIVLGYRIYRDDVDVLDSNTHIGATQYLDYTADINSFYSYQVSIITTVGESPLSNIAYFPSQFESPDLVALTQNNYNITLTQNGYRISL